MTSRRASLPGADELFRQTHTSTRAPQTPQPTADPRPADRRTADHRGGDPRAADHRGADPRADHRGADSRGTGRQKHDAKITVYISDEELLALEHARLALRAHFGLAVDRGRVVREAVAVLLTDFDEHGPDSLLVRRLLGESGG